MANNKVKHSFKSDITTVENTTILHGQNESLAMFICRRLGIRTTHAREFITLSLANALLMDRKQQDYGPHNISKAGAFGCLLRASDKFERLFNLYKSGRTRRAKEEPIHDSFRDVANYMIIALLVELNRWPNEQINLPELKDTKVCKSEDSPKPTLTK